MNESNLRRLFNELRRTEEKQKSEELLQQQKQKDNSGRFLDELKQAEERQKSGELLQQMQEKEDNSGRFLDELKQAEAKQKSEELLRQQQTREQEETFRVKVKPVLLCIQQYFMDLVKTLNSVKPVIPMNYRIEGFGEMHNLQQSNYRISGYTERGNECMFSFDSVGQHNFRILKNTELEMKALRQELWKYGIRHECRELLDDKYKLEKASFVIEPRVKVSFHFRVNLDTMSIDLYVRNFNQLGERIFTIKPCEVNRKFLDELAHYILKKPNTLKLTNKYQLSVQQRVALRDEVNRKDREEFDEWLKSMENQPDQTSKRKGLMGKEVGNHARFSMEKPEDCHSTKDEKQAIKGEKQVFQKPQKVGFFGFLNRLFFGLFFGK